MSEYTPTTDEVRDAFAGKSKGYANSSHYERQGSEFDRWLIAIRADAAAQVVPQPNRDVLAQVAGMIRRNCTPSTEAYQRGGDALIYAVADWVENPPEWVLAAQPTRPAAGDALDDLRESIEQEMELGGDASTLVPAVTEWLKRWPTATLSAQPVAYPGDSAIDVPGGQFIPAQPVAGDVDCNCGWGGMHDPDNPRCAANGSVVQP